MGPRSVGVSRGRDPGGGAEVNGRWGGARDPEARPRSVGVARGRA